MKILNVVGARPSFVKIAAHSPQVKGRVERCFGTLQDRLVKGLRVAGACGLEQANAYLEGEFLAEWEDHFAVEPQNPTEAHCRKPSNWVVSLYCKKRAAV